MKDYVKPEIEEIVFVAEPIANTDITSSVDDGDINVPIPQG